MAHLRVEGDQLHVELSTLEKAEALHGDIRLPLAAVQSVEAVDDPWTHLRGIRSPGTGIPNVIAVGTRRGQYGKDFAAVHGRGAAVVVDLEGADYQRVIVTLEDATGVASDIEAARHPG